MKFIMAFIAYWKHSNGALRCFSNAIVRVYKESHARNRKKKCVSLLRYMLIY